MSFIHFKFVSNKNFDKIVFDGVTLTLSQLKKLIFEKSKLPSKLDFDLEITNADTNEGKTFFFCWLETRSNREFNFKFFCHQVYKSDTDLIMKNSRVNVKRIMKSSVAPLRAQ